ncbi:MAG: AI-2E family transporter [Myxococcota bacterium]
MDSSAPNRASGIAFVIAALALAYLLAPFLVVVLAAGVLAVVTHGSYRRLATRVGRIPSATLLTLVVVIVIVAPVTLAGWLATRQVVELAETWVAAAANGEVGPWLRAQIEQLPPSIADWLVDPATLDTLQASVDGMVQNLFGGLLNRAGAVVRDVLSALAEGTIQAGVFVVVLWTLYVEGPALADTFERLSPLPRDQMGELFQAFEQFAYNVVVGMLATSGGQGAVAALGFWLVGASNIALLGFATAVGSQVPVVGAAVVWVPVVVSFALDGRGVAAVFVTLWSLLLTASVDNVVKPFIYAEGLRVHPVLVLLSLLGGLLTFGPAGLLVGPLVLVVFLTLIKFHDPGPAT